MNEVHVIYMKVTSKVTYGIVKAILEMKQFTQYFISKKKQATFSLVNRIVNWFVSHGYIAKRARFYEVVSPVAILNLFPLYRKMKPFAVFDINLPNKEALKLLKAKGTFCLTTALSYYDEYYRDTAIYIYLEDKNLLEELKSMPKGYTHIECYKDDLGSHDFVRKDHRQITDKIRTIIDLFCANKTYAAERLIKKEWV